MELRLDVVIPLTGVMLVIIYTIAGYCNSMLFPRQILTKWGKPGIALVIHGGAVSDLVILPIVFAYLIGKVSSDWDTTSVWYAGMIGFTLTLGNQLSLMFTQDKPDPMGWKEEWWSATILFHFMYMWGAVTLLALLLLYSPSASSSMITMTCIIIGVHTYFGVHLPFGMLNRFLRLEWVPEFLTAQAFVMEAGVWVALSGFAAHAAGLEAGVTVLSVGALLLLAAKMVDRLTNPVK